MKRFISCGLGLAALIAAGCAGGGGSSPSAVIPAPGGGTPITQSKSSITFSIKIAQSVTSNATHKFVSSGTASIGIVETDQTSTTPNAPVYVNVSTCPVTSGVATCNATVPATPGLDTFVISTYSAANGGGSVLGTGSLQYQIQPGVNNTTTPLTVNGTVASFVLTPQVGDLPLGQSEPLGIVAKDASGQVIAGTFANAPITLTGTNMTFSKSTFSSSSDFANITIAWMNGYQSSWSTSTITATTKDGVTGTTKVNPATGFAYYNVGSGGAADASGFKMIVGPDNKLYYDSLGIVTCNLNPGFGYCAPAAGAVHQFDPATNTDKEIATGAEAIGLTFDTNGALWIAGGFGDQIYYLPNAATNFTQSNLVTIPVPTPTPYPSPRVGQPYPFMRALVQDGAGSMWAVDTGHRVIKIPVSSPTAAPVTIYTPAPHTTPASSGNYGVGYANNTLFIMDRNQSIIQQFSTTSNTFGSSTALPWQSSISGDTSHPYDMLQVGSTIYLGQLDGFNVPFAQGGIATFNMGTLATTKIALPATSNVQPGALSNANGQLYYQDFGSQALGVVNTATGATRAYPLSLSGLFNPSIPNGVGGMSDGTAWFSCYGVGTGAVPPLCIGHTVYISSWSLWPGYSVQVFGTGTQAEQLVGIMEAPSANSGPFTAVSSNQNVCTATSVTDHNFNIVGVAAGACAVTVTDKNGLARTMQITVTTTSGTIQSRKQSGIGGII